MRSVTWIAADGTELPLSSDQDVFAAPGVQVGGLMGAKASLSNVPMQPGGRFHNVMHNVRDVTVPVLVAPASRNPIDTEAAAERVLVMLDPTRGDGRLRVLRNDGTSRELHCRCIDALVVPERWADSDIWPMVLVLRAADPYYYDASDNSVTVTVGGATEGEGTEGVSFNDPNVDFVSTEVDFNEGGGAITTTAPFFPFFPLRLGATEALSSFTIVNAGQVDAWPVWTIHGPASSVTMTNRTTGKVLAFDASVEAGDILTIDTRPGAKTVRDGSGNDLFANLTNASSLWPLVVGGNAIEVSMVGSTVLSSLTARWRRRWLTA